MQIRIALWLIHLFLIGPDHLRPSQKATLLNLCSKMDIIELMDNKL